VERANVSVRFGSNWHGRAAERTGILGSLMTSRHSSLSSDQRLSVQKLFEATKSEAAAVGERVIDAETALDLAFRNRSITPDRLAELTAHVGRLQGELRAVHLKYHLTTAELLSAEQSKRYAELRGYR
jgi:hypothetical protein